ncbi:MAG: MFS transporter [Actinomycetota bacterium]
MTRSEQWSLYVGAAMTSIGVSAVFALLAELRDRYDLPTWSLGMISASAFIAALIVQLGLARYADRGHGTRMLVGGVILAAVGLGWMAVGTELWQFVGARCLLGFGSGIFLPAARRAVIVSGGRQRAERLGTLYGVYLFGFVIGPPIAGLLASVGDVRLPFLVLAVPVLAVAPIVARVPVPAQAISAEVRSRPVVRSLVRSRPVIAAVLVVVSFRFSIGVFEPLWAVYLSDAGASTLQIALSLSVFALPMIVIAPLGGRFADRNGPRWASLVSAVATVPFMAAYGFTSSALLLSFLALLHGLLEAIESPGSQAALADAAPEDDAGAAQGVGEAAGSAAAALAALATTPLYDSTGGTTTWITAAGVMALLLGASWWLDAPRRASPPIGSEAVRETT